MDVPDVMLDVGGNEIIAALPAKGKSQVKSFAATWDGAAALTRWMQDIGLKNSTVRIALEEGTSGIALAIAEKLDEAGHLVRLSSK